MKANMIYTELGEEKQCNQCDEFYPNDSEFFFSSGTGKNGKKLLQRCCKACYMQKYKSKKKEKQQCQV